MAGHRGPESTDPVDAFFVRCGLPLSTRARCWDFVRSRYPDEEIQEARSQGYCSYTFCVGGETIVQFRPPAHKLDMKLVSSARDVYGALAPKTEYLGSLTDVIVIPYPDITHRGRPGRTEQDDHNERLLMFHVYSLTRLSGITLAEFHESGTTGPLNQRHINGQRQSLVRDFATFIASGWQQAHVRRVSPKSLPKGKVGASIRWRLEIMRSSLPLRFAPFLELVHGDMAAIEALPWPLTHGDIVPANVMVDTGIPDQLRLCGLLDWAEAEYLPFGVGLYGAEELLGHTGPDGHFRYYPESEKLRELLWSEITARIPELREPKMRDLVESAQILGMLLWHGIAFDNGKLDRVVEEGRDDEEIRRLDLFFSRHVVAQLKATTTDIDRGQNSKSLGLSTAIMGTWAYLKHLRWPGLFLGKL